MTFNSAEYLIFLPLVVLLHFLLPHKFRWMLLLAASFFFYMYWKPVYGILLLISISISFGSALMMSKSKTPVRRRVWFFTGLTSDVSLLFFFKYFNFVNESLSALSVLFSAKNPVPNLDVILPVGISFYTFQSLSYLIDVYRNNRLAETHFGKYALYISFFPQLVAGPIERSEKLIPQLNTVHFFSLERTVYGMRLIIWGLFKKLVLADSIAVYINDIYSNIEGYSGFPVIISLYLYAYFIYCDFSAYSDIAVGSAKILGYDLTLNFNKPFSARSYSGLWARWHITLTRWMTDYIYKPFVSGTSSLYRTCLGILFVFFIIGLWHGANWTFVFFGLQSGAYIVISLLTKNIRKKISSFIGIEKFPVIDKFFDMFLTVTFFASNSIFFRAENLSDSLYIIRHIFAETRGNISILHLSSIIILLVIFEFIQSYQKDGEYEPFANIKPAALRWTIYLFLFFFSLMYLNAAATNFYYFQF